MPAASEGEIGEMASIQVLATSSTVNPEHDCLRIVTLLSTYLWEVALPLRVFVPLPKYSCSWWWSASSWSTSSPGSSSASGLMAPSLSSQSVVGSEPSASLLSSQSVSALAIVEEEGPGSLFLGAGPTLIGYFVQGSLKYGLYDAFKPVVAAALPVVSPRLAVLVCAAVVAEALGHPRETALTLGKCVAGLNAQSKGRMLGIFGPPKSPERGQPPKKVGLGEDFWIELCDRGVPVKNTDDGVRAVVKDKPIDPAKVETYLAGKFGDALTAVTDAMQALAGARVLTGE